MLGGENGFSIWFRNDRELYDRKIWGGRGFKEEIILRQLTFTDIFLYIKDITTAGLSQCLVNHCSSYPVAFLLMGDDG